MVSSLGYSFGLGDERWGEVEEVMREVSVVFVLASEEENVVVMAVLGDGKDLGQCGQGQQDKTGRRMTAALAHRMVRG